MHRRLLLVLILFPVFISAALSVAISYGMHGARTAERQAIMEARRTAVLKTFTTPQAAEQSIFVVLSMQWNAASEDERRDWRELYEQVEPEYHVKFPPGAPR